MLHSATHVLVQGDTASVFYAALCAFQLKKRIIHLEAGMRTHDLENPYPEEGYRQMVSRLANIHLCPSEEEAKNLLAENIVMPQNIHVIGNTILDLVKSYGNKISYDKKVLITLHRRENWSSYKSLVEEIYKLAATEKMSQYAFYFIIHMNPSLQGIIDELKFACPKNMNIITPLDHKDLIGLLSGCEFVITDSGGIQEEANFLGKHMYVLRKVTERNSISDVNLTLLDQDKIVTIEPGRIGIQGYEYGRGDSCEMTYEILFDQ
jgi:UDP-N-acetylglucosamine 2-epimerase (non-hydrolysing)